MCRREFFCFESSDDRRCFVHGAWSPMSHISILLYEISDIDVTSKTNRSLKSWISLNFHSQRCYPRIPSPTPSSCSAHSPTPQLKQSCGLKKLHSTRKTLQISSLKYNELNWKIVQTSYDNKYISCSFTIDDFRSILGYLDGLAILVNEI